jgi:hypothetical protein
MAGTSAPSPEPPLTAAESASYFQRLVGLQRRLGGRGSRLRIPRRRPWATLSTISLINYTNQLTSVTLLCYLFCRLEKGAKPATPIPHKSARSSSPPPLSVMGPYGREGRLRARPPSVLPPSAPCSLSPPRVTMRRSFGLSVRRFGRAELGLLGEFRICHFLDNRRATHR